MPSIVEISAADAGQALQWPRLFVSRIDLDMQKPKVPAVTRERLLRSARRVMKNAYAPFSHLEWVRPFSPRGATFSWDAMLRTLRTE
jgi:hypothetical protein